MLETKTQSHKTPVFTQAEKVLDQHFRYLQRCEFRGWDVFDGLNSHLFQKTPLSNSRRARIAWIQLFKQSPLNFRGLAGVPHGDNPKALALFISGLVTLSREKYIVEDDHQIKNLLDRLRSLCTRGYLGKGWGYNFFWQARVFTVPAFKPNMVVSSFVGHALLDLYEYYADEAFLQEALDVSEFILHHCILSESLDTLCFSYIPDEDAVVHNVNLLGAAYLARLYALTGEAMLRNKAEKSVRFSVNAQREDGAWVYGGHRYHQWVDNFHTGYNLTAVFQYQQHCSDRQFENFLTRGLHYHIRHHYTQSYIPKYSNVSLYPIDIHCYAQAILSAVVLRDYWPDVDIFLENIVGNAITEMFDAEKHFFYYQKNRFYTNRVPYIRWSQAWMFLALSKYFQHVEMGISKATSSLAQ